VIHPTAIVDPGARLGENVSVGPFAVVGPNCVVGANTELGPHVVLEEFTSVGSDCQVRAGAVLGGPPQDAKFKGERSFFASATGT
jgi:UDP-N-acetylglucosamine acyltransferase